MKNGIHVIVATLAIVLLLAGCGGTTAEKTTSSPPVSSSNPPVTTTSIPPNTSSVPSTSSLPPVTTSSLPPVTTSSLPPVTTTALTTTNTTASNVKMVKTAWGIPPLCTTHPMDGAFAACYTCHLAGGAGALNQIDGAHSCDECHEPKGPGLTYNCTGGSPDPMPSCKMCHGSTREYDGTKKH